MRIPELAKDLLKYFPVLAVLAATVIGPFLGKELYPATLDSQSTIRAQAWTEPNPQLLPGPGAAGACFGSVTYLSLPPKCKTADGEFIPAPGISNFFEIPERK